MKCKKFILGALAALSIFVFFPTCEIGLGESVDTEPPTGEITSPGVNAVIRDAFAIQGTWKDEATIKQVSIELKYTSENSNKGKKYTYDATVNQNGTWICKVDPLSETQPLVDGTYLATINIYDNGGHKTTRERSYVIDNTAPVIVLQRPSSILSSSASDTDTYGQKFTIQGQAADDNNLNKIEVEIYSDEECTEDNLLKTITLNNVPLAINNDVASYVSGDTKKESDYSKIYFADEAYQDLNDMNASEASKTRYCKIIAYDGAQRYPAKGEEKDDDSTGNKQTNYYLYDDISGSILSTYKVNELYAMFNGTYPSSDSSRSVATTTSSILEQLEDKVQTVAKFNLNPKNNPTFSVSGKDQLTDGWTTNDAYNISSGSQVVVEVSPGLDGISLNKDSLKVYFVEYNATTKKVGSVKFYPVTERQAYGSGYKFITTINSSYLGDDNTSKTKIGSNYIFGVDGWDKSNGDEAVGNTIIASGKGYGFHLASSGVAPTLNSKFETSSDNATWTEVTDSILYLKANTYVKISGTVSVEEGTPDFSLLFGDNDSGASLTQVQNAENKFTFEKIFKPVDFGTSSSQRQITVRAWQDKLTTSKTYTVLYDIEGPVITLSEVSPVSYNYIDEEGNKEKENGKDKKYLNGENVSIKIAVSDKFDIVDTTTEGKLPVIQILDSTGAVKITSEEISNPANYTWENINTKVIPTGAVTIRVIAYDRAGNQTILDTTGYTVDQSTDTPVILPSDNEKLTFKITENTGLTNQKKNIFASGAPVSIRIVDDDELKSIVTTLDDGSGTPLVTTKDLTSLTDYTYIYTLPVVSTASYYTLKFTVLDVNNIEKSTGTFAIKIKTGAPSISAVASVVKDKDGNLLNTSLTNGDTSADSNYFENTVSFKSGYDKYNVYCSIDSNPFEKINDEPLEITASNVQTYVHKVKPEGEDGKTLSVNYTYKIAGIDEDGETDSNTMGVECSVDRIKPGVTITTPKSDTAKTGTNSISESEKAYTFIGTIQNESNNPSGVYYKIVKGTDSGIGTAPIAPSTSLFTLSTWTDVGFEKVSDDDFGTKSWETTINFVAGTSANLCEGKNYVIYLYVVDAAGNLSTAATRKFDVDMSSPIVKTYLGSEELTDATQKVETVKNYEFKYSATDTFGLDATNPITLKITKDDLTTALDSNLYTDTVDENGIHTVVLADTVEDGIYTYTVIAKDKVGKTTSVTKSIIVDTVGPVIDIKTDLNTYLDSKDVRITGSASDASDIYAIWYVYGSENMPVKPVNNTKVDSSWTASGQGWKRASGTQNWTITELERDSADGNAYKLFICAVDANGLTSENIKETVVKYDFKKPTVTASGLNDFTTNSNITITGTVWDSNGIDTFTITEGTKVYVYTLPENANLEEYKSAATSTWSITFPVGSSNNTQTNYLSDGKHTISIKAIDKAGKSADVITKNITVDTIAPSELVLTALPTPSDTLGQQMTLRGTSSDAVSGIASIELTITDATETAGDNPKTFTATATGTTSWFYIMEFASTDDASKWQPVFATEGKKKITLKATDVAGNSTTSFKVANGTSVTKAEFTYDKEAPKIIIDNAAGKYIAGGSQLTGSVSDSYKLDTLKVSINGADVQDLTKYTKDSTNKTGTWKQTIPNKDGTYKYQFVVKDAVGHMSYSDEIEKVVDTSYPNIIEVKLAGKEYIPSTNWYPSQTVSVEVLAKDVGESGISSVEYSTDALSEEHPTWTALNYNSTSLSYKGAVIYSESGSGKTLRIRASDNAGNITYFDGVTENGIRTDIALTLNVDETYPDFSVEKIELGDNEYTEEILYINGAKKLVIYGKCSDKESGINEIEFTAPVTLSPTVTYSKADSLAEALATGSTSKFDAYNTLSKTEIKLWKAEFSTTELKKLKDNSGKLTIKGENGAGLSESTTYSLIWDNTAPSISTGSFEEVTVTGNSAVKKDVYKKTSTTSTVTYYTSNTGKTYKLSGTASDRNGLASVTIEGLSGGSQKGSGYPEEWIFEGCTLTGSDGEQKEVIITATDKAGNTSQAKLTVEIDNTAPIGIHLLDTAGKDLFFRIGKYDNDEVAATANQDKEVGGKYSNGTYGNDNSIIVRGRFIDIKSKTGTGTAIEGEPGDNSLSITQEDNASGLKALYYYVFNGTEYKSVKNYLENLKKTDDTATDKNVIAMNKEIMSKVIDYNQTISLDSASIITKRVFYTGTPEGKNVKGKQINLTGTPHTTPGINYASITTNFEKELTGFVEGQNYLVLVAEDNAGNCAVDTVYNIPLGSDEIGIYNNFSLNVDTQKPEISSDQQFKNTKYINPDLSSESITIYGIAEDKVKDGYLAETKDISGIKSVEIEVNGKTISKDVTTSGTIELDQSSTEGSGDAAVTYSKEKTKWTATINANAFSEASGNITVMAKVTDWAGNSKSDSVVTVNVDKEAPTVIFNKPSDADTTTKPIDVNGTIDFTGTASDNTILSSIEGIYYMQTTTAPSKPADNTKESDLTGWTKLTKGSLSGTSSWTVSGIDTTSFVDATSTAENYYFVCAAKDSAGNIGYSSPLALRVDQNTDRPKVTITSTILKNNNALMSSTNRVWLTSDQLYFNVTDDDGYEITTKDETTGNEVTTKLKLEYSFGGTTYTEASLNNGSGSIVLSSEDVNKEGNQNIYFRVTDAKRTEFISKDTNATDAIYLTDGTNKYGDKTNKNTILYGTVDTKAPTLNNIHLYAFDKTLETPAWIWTTNLSSYTFGGDYKTINLYADATDTSGIDTVVATYSGLSDSSGIEKTGRVEGTLVELTSDPLYGTGHTYKLSNIPCDVGDGSITIKITATDKAGKTTSSNNIVISVDNTKPVVRFTAPSSTQYSSGNITASGTTDSLGEVYYALSPSGTSIPENGDSITSWTPKDGEAKVIKDSEDNPKDIQNKIKWEQITDATLSWSVSFDKKNNDQSVTGTHDAKTFNDYLVDWGITTTDALNSTTAPFDTIVKMYLWIKSVDSVGNTKEEPHLILLDPQGDRPTITYSFPEVNGSSHGAEVRVAGTANDNKTVKRVWLQIISGSHEYGKPENGWTGKTFGTLNLTRDSQQKITDCTFGSITKDDLDYLASIKKNDKEFVYNIYNRKKYASQTNPERWTAGKSNLDLQTNETAEDYAILTTLSSDGNTWYEKINTKSEFNPSTGTTNPVCLRVYAEDDDGKFSINADRWIKFDSDNPVISDVYLKQAYSIAGTVTASKEYSPDMFVNGEWYLTGKVHDADAISSLVVKIKNDAGTQVLDTKTLVNKATYTQESGATAVLYAKGEGTTTAKEIDGVSYYLYDTVKFWYRLGTSEDIGSLNLEVVAEDATDNKHEGKQEIKVNYDNTPPELLSPDEAAYNLSPEVKSENGYFTFGSQAKEKAIGGKNQSEVDFVAFYFMRRDTVNETKTNKVFNPMYAKTHDSNFVTVGTSSTVKTLGSEGDSALVNTVVYDNGIYWLRKPLEERNANTLNVLPMEDTSQIHKGSVIKIGGTIYPVTGVTDNSSVTIKGNPPVTESVAYVALALIVDNTTQESSGGSQKNTDADKANYGYGYWSAPDNDDGDLMVEKLRLSDTTATWEANIFSKNIPDGPIELHYVVFDKAGNYSIGIVGNKKIADFVATSDTNTNALPAENRTSDITEVNAIYTGTKKKVSLLYVDEETATYKKSSGSALTDASVSASLYNNVKHKKAAFVSNNAPRLANITVGSDRNGNNNFDTGETVTLYTSSKNWKDALTSLTAGSRTNAFITAKGKTVIRPEILGGNKDLYYTFDISKNDGTSITSTASGDKIVLKNASGTALTGSEDETTVKTAEITMQIGDFTSKNITDCAENAPHKVSFTIWDSTDATQAGTSSQHADMDIYMAVAIRDSSAPDVSITPFKWAGLKDNSIYESSKANKISDLQGHIELEKELPDKFKTNGSGEYDRDPKVSGSIVIKGTITDTSRLSAIYLSVPGMGTNFKNAGLTKYTGKKMSGETTLADYSKLTEADGFYPMATYTASTSTWSATTSSPLDKWTDYGFKFSVDTSTFDSTGHTVTWTLSWNTEKIADIAQSDVRVQVLALDAGTPTATTGTSGDLSMDGNTRYIAVSYENANHSVTYTENNKLTSTTKAKPTAYYKMDVVPYIKGIENAVGKANKKDASVFGRSATGSYPVYYYDDSNRETFKISGFNLGSSPTVKVNSVSAASSTSIPVTSTMTSGNVVVTVNNTMRSLNNENNDDAHGDYDDTSVSGYDKYKNYYNRQPNSINNSNLTDDCKVSVWNIAQVVSDTSIRYPTMRVGKDTNQTIAFVYDSSSDAVKAYKSTSVTASTGFNLGTSWTQWYDTAVAVDKDGNLYGSAMNGDTGAGNGNARYAGKYANNLFFAKNTSGTQSTWAYNSSNYAYAIESGFYGKITDSHTMYGRNSFTYNDYEGQFYATRVLSPKIATDNNGYLYMAYYDRAAGQVKFRYGTSAGNGGIKTLDPGNTHKYGDDTYWEGGKASADDYHVIAGPKDIYDVSAVESANEGRAGEYVAVGATSTGHAIVVWYSESDQGLFYTYNTDPSDSTKWEDAVRIDGGSEFVGWYVDLVVDDENGVHIAYYDASNGDLKYAYVKDHTKPAEAKAMSVDSYLTSGTNLSISVMKSGDNYVPYISCYLSSLNKTAYTVRTAWLSDAYVSKLGTETAANLAGVDSSDDFTGVWEVMTVPLAATTSIPLDYSVGIGIKGNKPILGYGTMKGLEVAQLK